MISTMAISSGQQRLGAFDPVDSRLAGWVVAFGGCALLGAGLWTAWLAQGSTDPDASAYSAARLAGCAATVGVVTAVLSRWRNPLVVAGGITFGFLELSTAFAAAQTELSGPLWLIGTLVVLFALVVVTVPAAAVGYAWRRWRTTAPARAERRLPTDLWRTGTALVVVAGFWLLAGAVASQTLPLAWNYTALLHVPLDLLAAVAVIAGVVMTADSLRHRRALGLRLRPLAPAAALIAALVVAVLAGRAIAAVPGVSAGDGFNGQVGVMSGPDGTPVAVLGLCQGTVDALLVQDVANEQLLEEGDPYSPAAELEHDGALDGIVQVDLTQPPTGWSGSALGDAASGEEDLRISATGHQSVLNDTFFTRAEIQDLAPGMVTYSVWEQSDGPYSGNEQVPLADFADIACTNPGRNG